MHTLDVPAPLTRDAFLVLARCELDDVPLRLAWSETEARDYCAAMVREGEDAMRARVDAAADRVYSVGRSSRLMSIGFVRLVDGSPARYESVVSL